jgi:hypothetical protein
VREEYEVQAETREQALAALTYPDLVVIKSETCTPISKAPVKATIFGPELSDGSDPGPVIHIELSGSIIAINECDKPLFDSYKWLVDGRGYVLTDIQREDGSKRTVGLHRLILRDPEGDVDHIDRQRLNNTRANLRACTRSENCMNIPNRAGKTSKYRGVSKSRGKWVVVIRIGGKVQWIGSYGTEEEAAAIAAPYFANVPALTTHATHPVA